MLIATLILAVDWEGVLQKYGFPMAALFVVVLAVVYVTKKVLVPFFSEYIKSIKEEAAQAKKLAEEASDQVQSMLTTQIDKTERAKERLESMQDQVFTGLKDALENSVTRQDKQIEMMSEILTTSRESREYAKRVEERTR